MSQVYGPAIKNTDIEGMMNNRKAIAYSSIIVLIAWFMYSYTNHRKIFMIDANAHSSDGKSILVESYIFQGQKDNKQNSQKSIIKVVNNLKNNISSTATAYISSQPIAVSNTVTTTIPVIATDITLSIITGRYKINKITENGKTLKSIINGNMGIVILGDMKPDECRYIEVTVGG